MVDRIVRLSYDLEHNVNLHFDERRFLKSIFNKMRNFHFCKAEQTVNIKSLRVTNIVPLLVKKNKDLSKKFKKYLFKMENDFLDLKLKVRGKGLFDLFLARKTKNDLIELIKQSDEIIVQPARSSLVEIAKKKQIKTT